MIEDTPWPSVKTRHVSETMRQQEQGTNTSSATQIEKKTKFKLNINFHIKKGP